MLVHEGADGFRYYVGNYDDWLRRRKQSAPDQSNNFTQTGSTPTRVRKARATKLSYKDQRELERLPQNIEAMEAQISELYAEMNKPAFFQQSSVVIKTAQEKLAESESTLERIYARWEELENAQAGLRAQA